MKVLLVGGGSGGHVTPLLAVAHELKRVQPRMTIIAATDKHNKFERLLAESPDISSVTKISAGKLRRYHNQSLLEQLLDLHTTALNIRDSFRVMVGTFQAIGLLRQTRPDVIFIKGGFVGVPVGIAAHLAKVPFITHDSDTQPGLANRLIARWAAMHAVGMSEQFYAYPKAKTVQVGIPVGSNYKTVTETLKKSYRQELNIPVSAKVVLVIGGSLGAARLNQVVGQVIPTVAETVSNLYVIHQTGGKTKGLPASTDRYRQPVFIDDLYKYSGAADVVISRAGANSMAELAAQGRAVIVVPAPQLTGGHQLTNGAHIAEQKAGIVLSEDDLIADPTSLATAMSDLLTDTKKCQQLSHNLATMYKTNAAAAIADIVVRVAA